MKVMSVTEVKSSHVEPGRAAKTLINEALGSKNVEVIWMEVPAGWKSDVQTRDVEELLYVLSGKCAITSGNKKIIGTSGTLIYIPPGETHQHHNIGDQTFSQLVVFAPPLKR